MKMASDDFEFLRPEPDCRILGFVDLIGDQLLRRFFSNQRTREGDTTMATCFTKLLRDESGLVVSAELIMIITIAVISLTAGWGAVSTMLAEELEDVANSVGSLDQSFRYNGLIAPGHATCSGGGFIDNRNFVNVSTNTSASVAGGGFTQQSVAVAEAQVEVAAEPFVLVEEEYGVNVQIDEALLLQLEILGIVTIREDGAVILLREDLIEIQEDGSLIILDEELRQQIELRMQTQTEAAVQTQEEVSELEACRKELQALREQLKTGTGSNSEELQRENARLRELIERLSQESGRRQD